MLQDTTTQGFMQGLGHPWRRKWQPTPTFLSRESHGQRSLAAHRVTQCRTRLSNFHFHFKDKGKIYSMITSVDSCMLSQILCSLMDCNQPVSSIHGIFQARIPEQVAIFFLHGIFQSRDGTCISCIDRQTFYLLSL